MKSQFGHGPGARELAPFRADRPPGLWLQGRGR